MLTITSNPSSGIGAMFLPGLPPEGITWEQYVMLGDLHATAVQRGDASTETSPYRAVGGWNLIAPSATFGKLHTIAEAILKEDYLPFLSYRDAKI
jgi:hypothetical protein